MIAALPKDVMVQLNTTDIRCMELLRDMIIRHGKKNPSKKEYACPGQEWLSQRLDRCRQSISESVQKLSRLGILRVTQRRPVRGMWSSNLYRLGYWLLRLLGRMKEAVFSTFSPCRLKATHSYKPYINSIPKQPKRNFSIKIEDSPYLEIIQRMAKNHPELV